MFAFSLFPVLLDHYVGDPGDDRRNDQEGDYRDNDREYREYGCGDQAPNDEGLEEEVHLSWWA